MGDVKEWDLFPTKMFESEFVAKDEILSYINTIEYHKHEEPSVQQSIDNNLQKVNEFKNKTIDSIDNKSILDEVLNYSNLKMLLSRKLKRVI